MMADPLNRSVVSKCLQEAIANSHDKLVAQGLSLHLATSPEDWSSLAKAVSPSIGNSDHLCKRIPFFFGVKIQSTSDDSVHGTLTFGIAYSTWVGRVLLVDELKLPETDNRSHERLLYWILSKVCIELSCERLIWKVRVFVFLLLFFWSNDSSVFFLILICFISHQQEHSKDSSSWYSDDKNQPEILREWLIHEMDKSAMDAFVSDYVSEVDDEDRLDDSFDRVSVERTITNTLTRVADARSDMKFRFRLAGESDVGNIERLVQGLADFENEPDAVEIGSKEYIRDGFSQDPLFYCILLDYVEDDGGVYTCGMAFIYFGYTIKKGRYLYLEDLFIEEGYRKKGGGNHTLKVLTVLGLATGCNQFSWVALDWNAPALGLYKKIGATVEEGIKFARYFGKGLSTFSSLAGE